MFVNVEKAYADDPPVSGEEVYFFHEDHIDRPAQVSEKQDYDSDGSLLQTNHYYDAGGPGTIWQAQYSPFGTVDDDHNSIGIEIGNPGTTGIVWEVPFRFPGQYEDPELTGLMFYNRYRFYIPSIGRYERTDPINMGSINIYLKSKVTQSSIITNTSRTGPYDFMFSSFPYTPPEDQDLILPIVTETLISHMHFAPYNYSGNNPIMRIDPDGLAWIYFCKLIGKDKTGFCQYRCRYICKRVIPKGNLAHHFIMTYFGCLPYEIWFRWK